MEEDSDNSKTIMLQVSISPMGKDFPAQLTTGFGQTNNAFGQPAQQPQQNQGGLFGGGATNTANTGFGFGGNNAPQQNNAFGGAATAARPTFGATGTSTFGATSKSHIGSRERD